MSRQTHRAVLITAMMTIATVLYADDFAAPRGDSVSAFDISVTIQSPRGQARSVPTSRPAPRPEVPARPVLHAHPGDALTARWRVANTTRDESFPDELVHLMVVREEQVGQQTVPQVDDDAPYESALTMDFEPGDDAHGEFMLTLEDNGPYLARVEILQPVGRERRVLQHAEVDLVIE